MDLTEEEQRATAMLDGKELRRVRRHREKEVLIEFSGGTRLFINASTPLELSIEGVEIEEE